MSTSVDVRRASTMDARPLHELAAATFGLACPPDTTQESIDEFIATNLSVERFADYLADPERILLIAQADGVATGYSILISGEPHDADVIAAITLRPTIELSKFYVLPSAHGSGLAAALMTATLTAAVDSGASGVWLGVNQHNARAIRFYRKHGFEQVGTKRFLVGARLEHDFVLERPLR